MKHIVFMTSSIAQDFCVELYKKFVDMVNFTASLHDYKVTLIIPKDKQVNYFNKYKDYFNISKDVNIVKIIRPFKIDGKIIYNGPKAKNKERYKLTLDKNKIYDNMPDKVDLFVYFSIFMNVNGVIPLLKESLIEGYTSTNFSAVRQQLDQVVIPALIHLRDNCKVLNIINDFYEPILERDYPGKCLTLSYYDTSDGLLSAKIFDANCQMIDCPEKDLDFVFGFTTLGMFRKYLSDYINTHVIETNTVKIFERNKYDNSRNHPINQIDYYKMLERSKFSLIASATKRDRFSWFRLIELLTRKNIPLLLEDSNYQDAKEFIESDLYEIYKKYNLFVSYNDFINDKIAELDYDTIWKEIENSDFLKKVLNKENNQKLFIERCLYLA